jgi:hypothetical protein
VSRKDEEVRKMIPTGTKGERRRLTLEEVRLALERDHVHEVEGVRDLVELLVSERDEESIGDELDVLAHEGDVHLYEGKR